MIEAVSNKTQFHHRYKDRTGERYGRMVALEPIGRRRMPSGNSQIIWSLKCDCGNLAEVQVSHLISGKIVSCGCLNTQRRSESHIKHGAYTGDSVPQEYTIWLAMRKRCNYELDTEYHNYGGRGIRVHPSWDDYSVFLKDVGPRPSKNHSLDRFPNKDGDYAPGNVRWATSKEQGRNKRNNRMIEIKGQVKCMSEWSEISGTKAGTILARLKRGILPEIAVFGK